MGNAAELAVVHCGTGNLYRRGCASVPNETTIYNANIQTAYSYHAPFLAFPVRRDFHIFGLPPGSTFN
ncbi:MAG: hypothetical protein OJF49_003890 [Ktedonobacterales bacterium]|nr:MAG: hypothetical protein OJF49_003890 [Ktedonobacterales bacterium]